MYSFIHLFSLIHLYQPVKSRYHTYQRQNAPMRLLGAFFEFYFGTQVLYKYGFAKRDVHHLDSSCISKLSRLWLSSFFWTGQDGSTGTGSTRSTKRARPMASTIVWCRSCVWTAICSSAILGSILSSSMICSRELAPGSPRRIPGCADRLDRQNVSPFAFGEFSFSVYAWHFMIYCGIVCKLIYQCHFVLGACHLLKRF